MVYVTGDCHGSHDIYKLYPANFDDKDMTRDDYLIVCGDMGIIWSNDEKDFLERKMIDFYRKKKYTVLFLDGNHENHRRLASLPEKEWNGGKIHVVSENIFHLMRGQIFHLDEKDFFVMGGAASTDKHWRTEGISWWPEEIPNEDERKEALKNLKEHNNKVDYVLSHTGPSSVLPKIDAEYRIDEYTDWLEKYINKKVKFKHWYFGHFHMDREITAKHSVLYNSINVVC